MRLDKDDDNDNDDRDDNDTDYDDNDDRDDNDDNDTDTYDDDNAVDFVLSGNRWRYTSVQSQRIPLRLRSSLYRYDRVARLHDDL
jgi:hypothetical protein